MPDPITNFNEAPDFRVETLGECKFASPFHNGFFVPDDSRVLYQSRLEEVRPYFTAGKEPPSLECGGPRQKIFFDPAKTRAGIVTCGGLCPGLNDVIRAIVLGLHYHYGVGGTLGFRYGYEGLVERLGHQLLNLTPDSVAPIYQVGGSILGSSRGPQDPAEMLDYLQKLGVNILFAVGGDGTLRGAGKISDEARRRGYELAVVGVPKTIDNDISFISQSFGFITAVSESRTAIASAHAEANGARNGIGLVKLMGRDSGFIAAFACLATSEVNYCLIPEVKFSLPRLLQSLQQRLAEKGHAVIVAAEGAGQDLLASAGERDASGNVKHGDIGTYLASEIKKHFKAANTEVNLKYIDPSYIIRSVPANARDSGFCLYLGHNAVHAAMAGRTNIVVGTWNEQPTHLPISVATSSRKKIEPCGKLWGAVLAATGQPAEL
ncbi:MAG: ATP-dependent 6-phosphofructokinase [Candidatus Sumerlaeaceae bacterium]|nr:ATP-dependent 6-phosphofructokinase [Candidatus Sumerlaeaceae bacterium]